MELAQRLTPILHDCAAVKKALLEYPGLQTLRSRIPLPARGTYVRHCVAATDALEIYVIAWAPGADTGMHTHPEGGCWLTILCGELWELTENQNSRIRPGRVNFRKGLFGRSARHRVIAQNYTYSVHVYAPAGLKSPRSSVYKQFPFLDQASKYCHS